MAEYRYKAFISYAHADEHFVTRLHKRLESYVLPKHLSLATQQKRLGSFFRDRDELAAGGELGEHITSAIENSEFLIVICSPHALDSEWVNQEIALFLESSSAQKILPIIVDTAPDGTLPIPAALTNEIELLSADARVSGDGVQGATLKLIAGLLQVSLDDLIRREQARRRRRLSFAGAAAAVAILAILGGLYLVQTSRMEAESRREQAALFVGPFVSNLAERIANFEKVGELDDDLSQALAFFADLNPAELDDTTLSHYRGALLSIGTVRIRQGKPEEALVEFNRARDLSQSMVTRDQTSAEYWHNLATHTYYIGEAYWEMTEIEQAADYILESMDYAMRAADLAPETFSYQLEVIFGLNNLGAVNTRLKNYPQAEGHLVASIARIEELQTSHPDKHLDLKEQHVEAVSWLAEIAQITRKYSRAFTWHEQEIELRQQLIDETGNPRHWSRLSDALSYYAKSYIDVGNTKLAIEKLRLMIDASNKAIASDPDNAFFMERLYIGKAMLANTLFENGEVALAWESLEAAEHGFQTMIEQKLQERAVRMDMIYVISSKAYIALEENPSRALELAQAGLQQAVTYFDREQANAVLLGYYRRCLTIAAAASVLLGQDPQPLFENNLDSLNNPGNADSPYRALQLYATGKNSEAMPIVANLREVGFKPVFFERMLSILQTSTT